MTPCQKHPRNPLQSGPRTDRREACSRTELRPDRESRTLRVHRPRGLHTTGSKNKTPLWERAQSSHSTKGTPGTVSGQGGVLQQSAAAGITLTSFCTAGGNKELSVSDVPDQVEELQAEQRDRGMSSGQLREEALRGGIRGASVCPVQDHAARHQMILVS